MIRILNVDLRLKCHKKYTHTRINNPFFTLVFGSGLKVLAILVHLSVFFFPSIFLLDPIFLLNTAACYYLLYYCKHHSESNQLKKKTTLYSLKLLRFEYKMLNRIIIMQITLLNNAQIPEQNLKHLIRPLSS